jgi:hypothetical protein
MYGNNSTDVGVPGVLKKLPPLIIIVFGVLGLGPDPTITPDEFVYPIIVPRFDDVIIFDPGKIKPEFNTLFEFVSMV